MGVYGTEEHDEEQDKHNGIPLNPESSKGVFAEGVQFHSVDDPLSPTADGFRTGTPEPSPQSQSFSRSYESILPTSLAYIVPSTRCYSPWRPDAVMSTTEHGRLILFY
ncbi:hypothetical protein OROGR_015851 [Orobanche gracilis]